MLVKTINDNITAISALDTAATGNTKGVYNFQTGSWTTVETADVGGQITIDDSDVSLVSSDSSLVYVDSIPAANVAYGKLSYNSDETISGTFGKTDFATSDTGIRALASVNVSGDNVVVSFDNDIVTSNTNLTVSNLTVDFSSGTAIGVSEVEIGSKFTYGDNTYEYSQVALLFGSDADTTFAVKRSTDVQNFTFAQIVSSTEVFQVGAVDSGT